jgi:hypothetical protein
MSEGIIKARWLRIYTISDDAVIRIKKELEGNLSVKIAKEIEFKVEDGNGNEIDPKIEAEGIDLLEKITQLEYLKYNHKMSDQYIEELITNMFKRVDPQMPSEKLNKLKYDYLNEKISISDTFYLLKDETHKSMIVVPESSVDKIIDKISEISRETPLVFELPDGPEFLLWLFSKYWRKSSIGRIHITNVSSVSNIEENNNHEYSHRANGDAERDSLEICFKVMLNKAITSIKFQLDLDRKFGNEIEIQIPDHRKSPKSFKFSIPVDSVIFPGELSKVIKSLSGNEQFMLNKSLGAYMFNSILFPQLVSAYKSEEPFWKNRDKEVFVKEIYDFAMKKVGSQ